MCLSKLSVVQVNKILLRTLCYDQNLNLAKIVRLSFACCVQFTFRNTGTVVLFVLISMNVCLHSASNKFCFFSSQSVSWIV